MNPPEDPPPLHHQTAPSVAPRYWPVPLASGQIRGTGKGLLLMVVTLGIYVFVWTFKTHDEMKRHSGEGLGGGVALFLGMTVGFLMPFFTAKEVGELYRRAGLEPPVNGTTGLWYLLGSLILVGPIVWFVKTNGALNRYWAMQQQADRAPTPAPVG
jgi:hypothetical protein